MIKALKLARGWIFPSQLHPVILSAMRTLLLLLLWSAALSAQAKGKTPKVLEAPQGQLNRAAFSQVLKAGPQRFIASLRVDAHLKEGRFVGFRLLQFLPNSSLINNGAVRPGDVILSVNKERLERPDQFMRIWEKLEEAQQLEVLLLRGTQRHRYRWIIEP